MSEILEAQVGKQVRRWEPYPAYKESGVDWLGKIPEHWSVSTIKALTKGMAGSFTDGDWIEAPFIEDEGIKLIQTGNIGVGSYREQGFRYISEDTFRQLRCTEVRPGDVLICRLADPVGRACIAPGLGVKMITSVDVCILKPAEHVEPRFVTYFLSSDRYLGWMNALCRGSTRDRISRSMLGRINALLPPPDEQASIADFLDRETAKIDALIAKKQKLVDYLKDQRVALIHRAVTQGISGGRAMKDTGLWWAPKVPAGWAVAPLYARYEVKLGKMLDAKRITGTSLAPYLRNVNVQWDHVNADDLPEMDFTEEERRRLALRADDLLVCEGGEVGRTAMWRGELPECYFQKAVHRLRPLDSGDHPRYFFYVMYAAAKSGVFVAGGNPNTIDHLTGEQLRRYRFPFPPAEEQKEIAEFLDSETSKIDGTIGRVEDGLRILAEYRAALISAAVTGKIDVRGVA